MTLCHGLTTTYYQVTQTKSKLRIAELYIIKYNFKSTFFLPNVTFVSCIVLLVFVFAYAARAYGTPSQPRPITAAKRYLSVN